MSIIEDSDAGDAASPWTSNLDSLFAGERVLRDAYLDPGVFEREMIQIFELGWVFIGMESEVENQGDFKLTSMGRRSVILSRGADGALHAFENRCPHRGATVCQSESGNTKFFRCGYHGWTFRNTGALAGVTYPDRYQSDLRNEGDAFCLPEIPSVESYRGLIFATFRKDGPSLVDHLGNALPYLDLKLDAGITGLSVRSGSQRLGYRFNWKIQAENTVDGYHANFVHRDTLTLFSETGSDGVVDVFGPGSSQSTNMTVSLGNGHSLLDSRPGLGESVTVTRNALVIEGGDVYRKQLVEEFGEERTIEIIKAGVGDGINLAVFPNLHMLTGQIRVIRPRTPTFTELEIFPTWFDGAPDAFNIARLRAHVLTYGPAGLIQPDDLEIFRRVGQGLGHSREGWVDLSRGSEREQEGPAGTTIGQVTDEVPQRGFWRQWRRMMESG